jgi:preprotein translocase subunit SecG
MLYGLVLLVHVIVSVLLVMSVLMQASKGGGLAGTFGGSGTTGGIFGGRGAAPLLVKVTTVCAVLFFLTSISLNFVVNRGTTESVLERTLRESGATGSQPAVLNEMPTAEQTDVTVGDTDDLPAGDVGTSDESSSSDSE